MPAAPAIARPVQCVTAPGGAASVIAMTRSIVETGSGFWRPGRVASCSSPSTPAVMSRACQRQIVGLALPVWRWIAIVPTPSALSSTIRARHTCFWPTIPRSDHGFQPLAIDPAKPNLNPILHPHKLVHPRTHGNLLLASIH